MVVRQEAELSCRSTTSSQAQKASLRYKTIRWDYYLCSSWLQICSDGVVWVCVIACPVILDPLQQFLPTEIWPIWLYLSCQGQLETHSFTNLEFKEITKRDWSQKHPIKQQFFFFFFCSVRNKRNYSIWNLDQLYSWWYPIPDKIWVTAAMWRIEENICCMKPQMRKTILAKIQKTQYMSNLIGAICCSNISALLALLRWKMKWNNTNEGRPLTNGDGDL